MACTDCLGRTPYGSLIATIILCLGVGLFCGTGYRALDITLNGIFRDLFQLQIPWLRSIQIAFFILGLAMALFAMVLLLFGFLSTGLTRENVCSTVTCVKGGGVSSFVMIIITYLINIGWMLMTYFCALPIFAYIMINNICQNEVFRRDYWYFDGYCLNLSRFGIYRNFTLGYDDVALCDAVDLSVFCQQVYDAGPMFCFAYAGALLIVLGLGAYLITFGSNMARLKATPELTNYKQAIEMDSRSLNGMY